MCTVAVIQCAQGLIVAGNRDERLTRLAAEPPKEMRAGGLRWLAPIDGEEGGTWTAVNELGVAFSLLNNYQASALQTLAEQLYAPIAAPISRGHVVAHVADCADVTAVVSSLRDGDLELSRVRPFNLIVARLNGGAHQLDWDGKALTIAELLLPALVVSNGGDLSRATTARTATFDAQRRNWSEQGPTDAQLAALFGSHEPAKDHYSVCMHLPPFAKTMSHTTIRLRANAATMRYVAGSPCEPQTTATVELQFRDNAPETRRS